MVLTKEIIKRNISAADEEFDIDKIYKGVKNKAEDLGYFFVENEQGSKPGKYGQELKFKFSLSKDVDFFGRNDIDLEFDFENLSKVKSKDKGDCKVTINGKMTIDYKNRWGMSRFNKLLLNLYSKIKDPEIKRKYMIPLIKDCTEIQNYIKDEFGFYTS